MDGLYMMGDQHAQQTLQWIKSFVIKYNICPFAKREIERNSFVMQVSEAKTTKEALSFLMDNVKLLDDDDQIETSFVIFPFFLDDFYDYLDFIDCAEAALFVGGYEGIYQIASFHPKYCFADAEEEDVTNYTNRSPYPMLHLLRESSLDKAISYYGDTSVIPENNKKCLIELGLEEVKNCTKF